VTGMDILASVLIFLCGVLSSGGGIGGGGVFIPLLILIGRFNAEEAIPLSTTLICGSSIANFIQMCRQRHPIRNKPLIDYDLALMLEPLSLVGTVVGVILNTMFPDWLLLILLIILLLLSLERTLVNGIKLWKQEKSSEYTIIPYEGQEEELSFLRGSIYNSKFGKTI